MLPLRAKHAGFAFSTRARVWCEVCAVSSSVFLTWCVLCHCVACGVWGGDSGAGASVKAFNEDQWTSFLLFSNQIATDLSNFDVDGAWSLSPSFCVCVCSVRPPPLPALAFVARQARIVAGSLARARTRGHAGRWRGVACVLGATARPERAGVLRCRCAQVPMRACARCRPLRPARWRRSACWSLASASLASAL